jgi:hypothetical protein
MYYDLNGHEATAYRDFVFPIPPDLDASCSGDNLYIRQAIAMAWRGIVNCVGKGCGDLIENPNNRRLIEGDILFSSYKCPKKDFTAETGDDYEVVGGRIRGPGTQEGGNKAGSTPGKFFHTGEDVGFFDSFPIAAGWDIYLAPEALALRPACLAQAIAHEATHGAFYRKAVCSSGWWCKLLSGPPSDAEEQIWDNIHKCFSDCPEYIGSDQIAQ